MGKSSRDKRDIYYRLAKEQGWRARSAFKLLQIQEQFDIFREARMIVDLCAAPGSWSQVLSKELAKKVDEPSKIVAVDLQLMAPLDDVIQIQGDITDSATAELIIGCFDGKLADLVVCDGAPDVIGLGDVDEYIQHQLVISALDITTRILRPGGVMVAKVFRGKKIGVLTSQLSQFFHRVTVAKPKCSRDSSLEAFAVCQGFLYPSGFVRGKLQSFLSETTVALSKALGETKPAPFVVCGGLGAFDSDRSYPLDHGGEGTYKQLEPVQPPIHPPHEKAQKMRKPIRRSLGLQFLHCDAKLRFTDIRLREILARHVLRRVFLTGRCRPTILHHKLTYM